MGCGIDEIRPACESGGETDDWTIKSHNQDFWVCIERLCGVEITAGEGFDGLSVAVFCRGGGGLIVARTGDGYVCTTLGDIPCQCERFLGILC